MFLMVRGEGVRRFHRVGGRDLPAARELRVRLGERELDTLCEGIDARVARRVRPGHAAAHGTGATDTVTNHMRVGFIGLGAMGLPMARHLVDAGHDVTVTSRSRGPIDAAVAAGAIDGGTSDEVAARERGHDHLRAGLVRRRRRARRRDAGAGRRQDRRRHVDHRSRRRARAARTCDGDRGALPGGAAVGRHRGRRAGHAHADGGRRRRRARGGPARARAVRRERSCTSAGPASARSSSCATTSSTRRRCWRPPRRRSWRRRPVSTCASCTRSSRTRPVTATPSAPVSRSRVSLPDGPASNDWQPGFMTDLMAKDLDLAIGFAARASTPAVHVGDRAPAARRRQRRRLRPRGLLLVRQDRPRARRGVSGSGGGTRTRSRRLNKPLLHQLSYPGRASDDSKALTRPMICRDAFGTAVADVRSNRARACFDGCSDREPRGRACGTDRSECSQATTRTLLPR